MELHCDGQYADSASGYKIAATAFDYSAKNVHWVLPIWITGFFFLVGFGLLMGLLLRSSRWALPTMGFSSFLALGLLLHRMVFPLVFKQQSNPGNAPYEIRLTWWFWLELVVTSFPMSAAIKNEWDRRHSRLRE
jgi:hypothetical protein